MSLFIIAKICFWFQWIYNFWYQEGIYYLNLPFTFKIILDTFITAFGGARLSVTIPTRPFSQFLYPSIVTVEISIAVHFHFMLQVKGTTNTRLECVFRDFATSRERSLSSWTSTRKELPTLAVVCSCFSLLRTLSAWRLSKYSSQPD